MVSDSSAQFLLAAGALALAVWGLPRRWKGHRHEALLAAALASSGDGILIFDRAGRVERATAGSRRAVD